MRRTALCSAILAAMTLSMFSAFTAEPKTKKKGKADDRLDPVGKPEDYAPGSAPRFFVWNDSAGWHIRTTTPGPVHNFSGSIRTEKGRLTNVKGIGIEEPKTVTKQKISKTGSAKLVEKTTKGDRAALTADGRELEFSLQTKRNDDGIDFQASPEAESLNFTLHIDGKEKTKGISIGKPGSHPRSASFTLPAHPGK